MSKIHYTEKYLLNPYHPVEVNVIGAGGTGCQVLTSLARISCALKQLGHPGLHVNVIDGDIVTKSNLGRQLFSASEVGLNKAMVLANRINRFFGFDWDAIRENYPYKDCTTANVTITCVDNVKARIEIGKFLRKNIKPKTSGDQLLARLRKYCRYRSSGTRHDQQDRAAKEEQEGGDKQAQMRGRNV